MKIGILGTGLMGAPSARRLAEEGHCVAVWNRTPEKAAVLADVAEVCSCPESLLAKCDIAILMLSDAPAIREVLSPVSNNGLLRSKTVIQMGTIGPRESICLSSELASFGADYFEAPVLGSIPEAASGQLIIMVGGSEAQFEAWEPLLTSLGTEPVLVGKVGQAAAVKLAMNQLIASLTSAFSLSLGLVQSHGVSEDLFMRIVRESALYAPTFDKKLSRMLSRNYSKPNFPLTHLLKDVELFLSEAESTTLSTESLQGLREILVRACRNEMLAGGDYSGLFEEVVPQ